MCEWVDAFFFVFAKSPVFLCDGQSFLTVVSTSYALSIFSTDLYFYSACIFTDGNHGGPAAQSTHAASRGVCFTYVHSIFLLIKFFLKAMNF